MTTYDTVQWFGTKSRTRRECKITILGTDQSITLPIEVTTKVIEVKHLLAAKLGLEPDDLSFIVKQASSHKRLLDSDEIRSNVAVKGVRSWVREKAQYLYPHCIIGAGHYGLRQALSFLKEGISNFAVLERHDRVGGTAWLKNANPTSKLQTELGVYHLQYDDQNSLPENLGTWPSRDDLLRHFHQVSEEYGILPHVRFCTEVLNVQVAVDNGSYSTHDQRRQHYEIVTAPVSTDGIMGVEETTHFATVSCYPGALTANIRHEYEGEDTFGGNLGYGMFDEFNYKEVQGGAVAVMGMGAFGVENVRTCLEHGATKVFLICRRKNIAVPRVVDWFINQSLYPPSAAMLLDMMKPMYDMIPDDPWDYYAVQGNKDRTHATIRQKSRFGIGDVYFLASYYGKVECVVDTIKRLRFYEVVLESGRVLTAEHFIKVLGFQPEMKIDSIIGIKEMVGFFANGDWRRWVVTEYPGIDAGRFGGTSLSPGAIQLVESMSWFINYPKDVIPLFEPGVLLRRKADKESNRPAYVWDPRSGSQITMLLGSGIVPGLAERGAIYGPLNRAKQLQAHPLEKYVDECAEDWKSYCELFKQQGDDRPFPPYPYTHEYVRELCARQDKEGEEEMLRVAMRGA